MRHRKARYKLSRSMSYRKATVTSIVKNLLIAQRITTTVDRAKATRQVVERLISIAKANTLAGRRRAFQVLQDHALVNLLFDDIAVRFKDRTSGFTRILKVSARRGDNARLAIFELTEIKEKQKPAKAAAAEKGAKTPDQEKPAAPAQESQKNAPAEPEHKKRSDTEQKPPKKFLGGIRKIFKKERDSL